MKQWFTDNLVKSCNRQAENEESRVKEKGMCRIATENGVTVKLNKSRFCQI